MPTKTEKAIELFKANASRYEYLEHLYTAQYSEWDEQQKDRDIASISETKACIYETDIEIARLLGQ